MSTNLSPWYLIRRMPIIQWAEVRHPQKHSSIKHRFWLKWILSQLDRSKITSRITLRHLNNLKGQKKSSIKSPSQKKYLQSMKNQKRMEVWPPWAKWTFWNWIQCAHFVVEMAWVQETQHTNSSFKEKTPNRISKL